MPITPFHMGPGIVIKAVLQGSFSLMVFGWGQILMDLQPLVALISDQGALHGFSHTYLGASLIALFAALSGKYLSEIGLYFLRLNKHWQIKIRWSVAFLSAFIACYSHVLLDSFMHADMQPFFPFLKGNALLDSISLASLHRFCIYCALIGGAVYFSVHWLMVIKKNNRY